jgi:hypothetical protein
MTAFIRFPSRKNGRDKWAAGRIGTKREMGPPGAIEAG